MFFREIELKSNLQKFTDTAAAEAMRKQFRCSRLFYDRSLNYCYE